MQYIIHNNLVNIVILCLHLCLYLRTCICMGTPPISQKNRIKVVSFMFRTVWAPGPVFENCGIPIFQKIKAARHLWCIV